MRVFKHLMIAMASLAVLAFGAAGAAEAAAFQLQPGQTCPSCWTKSCQVVGTKPLCFCFVKDEVGIVTPKYYVTHVVYAPPGKSSTVTYTAGSVSGSTTSVASSFKESSQLSIGASVSGPVFEGSGVKVSSGQSWGTSTTNATDITVENTSARAVAGKMNNVDHGDDEIWFLIRPKIELTMAPNSTCNAPARITWRFASDQSSSGVYFLYLKWLLNPNGMAGLPQNVRDDLARHGITERDFPELVKAHPFATFNVVAQHSNQCLAIPAGSQTPGQPTIQYPCLGPSVADQGWRLVSVGKDLVQIVVSHSNQCLAVPAGSQANGQAVIQHPCLGPGVLDQSWRLERVGDRFRIRAAHSNKCLAVPANSQTPGQGVIQYDCIPGVADQLWHLKPSSFQRPTNASIKNPALPGDSNRFEFVKRIAYVPAPMGQTPDTITDTLTRKVMNSNTVVTDKSRTTGITVTGSQKFAGWLKLSLSGEQSWTWTEQTSVKQTTGVSTVHQIKVGQPTSEYTGPTFLNVYHDKLWKTYVFLLDSSF